MSTTILADPQIRDRILTNPHQLLDDSEIVRALVAAEDAQRGDNVIDLRSVAMDRLETRLDRLEETHRNVIAAAYENLAGTNMIHRAVLDLLEPRDFAGFLRVLAGPVADTLRVASLRLVLETSDDGQQAGLQDLDDRLALAERGYCCLYADPTRAVTLCTVSCGDPDLFGTDAEHIRSEACLSLSLGPDRLPGMLVLGAADPQQFAPGQGTDLLAFLGGVVERSLQRFLA